MEDIRLRCATDADSEEIYAILGEVYSEYPGCILDRSELPDLATPATTYAEMGGGFWVAEDSAGVLGFTACAAGAEAGQLELKKLYVRKRGRGKKLGRRFIQLVEVFGRSHGRLEVFLYTDTRFKTAHKVYAKCGYQRQEEIRELGDISQSLEYRYERSVVTPLAGPLLLLMDVDGTLLNASGAGRRAMDQAFLDVYGVEEASAGVPFAGSTDLLIFETVAHARGVGYTAGHCADLTFAYLRALDVELKRTPGSALEGSLAFLEEWSERPEVILGLGTGNFEAGALAKMQSVGLPFHHRFGGFGADGMVRSEVIGHGISQGRAQAGTDQATPVIFGDTQADIDAANANGALTIGIAGGPLSVAELLIGGAYAAFPHLGALGVRELLQALAAAP